MTTDEIRTTLFRAAALRIPRFDERDTVGGRIGKLENYLLLSAQTGGDLEEARLHAQQALFDLTKLWDDLQGWEIHAPESERARTKAAIVEAKRLTDPDLYDSIMEAKWLIARLTEQIQRLRRMGDDQIASRVYSLMAGS